MSRAVVVMGRVPRAGRCKTRLTPRITLDQAAQLYHAFLQDVFAVAAEAARRADAKLVFSVSLAEDEDLAQAEALAPAGWRVRSQHGADLGARIASAVAAGEATHTVVLGSDAPTMDPGRIVEAFDALAQGEVRAVFGPTGDGGYDLVALSEAAPELLEGIPWSTGEVMEVTRAAARRAGIAIRELSQGYDIDGFEDLPRALEDARRPGSLATRTAAAIEATLRRVAEAPLD